MQESLHYPHFKVRLEAHISDNVVDYRWDRSERQLLLFRYHRFRQAAVGIIAKTAEKNQTSQVRRAIVRMIVVVFAGNNRNAVGIIFAIRSSLYIGCKGKEDF